MTIKLCVSPQFREEETFVSIEGEHEGDVLNILISRLAAIDYEVAIFDENTDCFTPYEEYEL